MIECVFCCSPKDRFIFTECGHFVCQTCASQKWDKRYTLKCCGRNTFLAEETTEALIQLNQQHQIWIGRENKQNKQQRQEVGTRTPISRPRSPVEIEQNIRQQNKIQEIASLNIIESLQVNPCEQESKQDYFLSQMEKVLSDQVGQVKHDYDIYRKQIERREQQLLQQLYNIYSEHLHSLKTTCSHKDVANLKEKLLRTTQAQAPRGVCQEGKQDKILEKLDYNQQKMKEKLNRHYDLLK